MLDLGLAVGHHLLIFALFGVLVDEFIIVGDGMGESAVTRVAAIDVWYGALAALIIVGFARAIFAAKGWAYYSHNIFFWSKIGTFALIGLLSAPPTLAYIRWRRAKIAPSDAQVRVARRYLWIEIALFVLLPIFAAAMARGYGDRMIAALHAKMLERDRSGTGRNNPCENGSATAARHARRFRRPPQNMAPRRDSSLNSATAAENCAESSPSRTRSRRGGAWPSRGSGRRPAVRSAARDFASPRSPLWPCRQDRHPPCRPP